MGAAVLFALRIALGTILVSASFQKLRSPRQFISGVAGYDLLPRPVVAPAAMAVLLIEGATGISLLVNFASTFAVLTAVVLFALFCTVLAISLLRRNDVPCFCFGAEQAEPISLAALVRASLLLTLSGVAALIAMDDGTKALGLGEIAPALTLAAGIIIVTRLIGAFPFAYRAYRARPAVSPTHTQRISFRREPLEFSFKQAVAYRREAGRVWPRPHVGSND